MTEVANPIKRALISVSNKVGLVDFCSFLVKEFGVEIIDLNSKTCITMLAKYIQDNPEVWNEDIGEE